MAYINDNLNVIRRTDLENQEVEVIWLEVCPFKSKRSLLIGSIYRPPSYTKADDLSLEANLERVYLLNKETIFLGDVNIDGRNIACKQALLLSEPCENAWARGRGKESCHRKRAADQKSDNRLSSLDSRGRVELFIYKSLLQQHQGNVFNHWYVFFFFTGTSNFNVSARIRTHYFDSRFVYFWKVVHTAVKKTDSPSQSPTKTYVCPFRNWRIAFPCTWFSQVVLRLLPTLSFVLLYGQATQLHCQVHVSKFFLPSVIQLGEETDVVRQRLNPALESLFTLTLLFFRTKQGAWHKRIQLIKGFHFLPQELQTRSDLSSARNILLWGLKHVLGTNLTPLGTKLVTQRKRVPAWPVINQLCFPERHFSANGISLRLSELQMKFFQRSLQALLSSVPRGFATRSRVLARLASLAQIGRLARRLEEIRRALINIG